MKGQKTIFSHATDEWETPQNLFDELNKEFNFYCDLSATEQNAKCKLWTNDIENFHATGKDINHRGEYVWCNPPYSKVKLFLEFQRQHALKAVFLVYARTDTKWFHEYVYNKPNVEIRFIKGRLKFSGSKNSAPAPSMLIIFK